MGSEVKRPKQPLTIRRVVRTIIKFVLYISFRLTRELWAAVHDRIWPLKSGKVSVCRVLWRDKCTDIDTSRLYDFLLQHETYIDNQVMLTDPHWSLYTFSEENAYFVRTPRRLHEYDIVNTPFIYWKQYTDADRVGVMSIKDMVRLADKASDHSHSTIWYANCPRSGSTLISQLLYVPAASVVFGEPDPFALIGIHYELHVWTPERCARVLIAALRMFTHHVPNDQVIVLKMRPNANILAQMLRENVPEVRQMFAFRRDIAKMVDSTERAMVASVHLPMPLVTWLKNRTLMHWYIGMALYERLAIATVQPRSNIELAWIAACAPYARFIRDRSVYDIITTYEDVLDKPQQEMTRLFRLCGLPLSHVHEALERMAHDSQRNTAVSRKKLQHVQSTNPRHVDPECARRVARILQLPEQFFIENYVHEDFEQKHEVITANGHVHVAH